MQASAARWRSELLEKEPATGLHLLYIGQEEAEFLESLGITVRHSFQYQWRNEGYACFNDFLNRFRSKRRAQIRRERRAISEMGVTVRMVRGDEATEEELNAMWLFYASTVDQFQWQQRYLNKAFFLQVRESMGEDLLFLFAERDGEIVAGTFNLLKNGVFYGRYWGCRDSIPFLHFELCCYAPVELAIQEGWARVKRGRWAVTNGTWLSSATIRSARLRLPGLRKQSTGLLRTESILDAQIESACGWVFKDLGYQSGRPFGRATS